MSVRGRLAAGLRLGLVAGVLLGGLEAAERVVAVRAFVAGPAELAWLAVPLLAFPVLTLALAGLAGGVLAAAFAALRSAPWLPDAPLRAVLGAAAGAAAAGWCTWALTFTVRFDPLVAKWRLLLAAGALAGALAGLAWPWLAGAGRRLARGRARALAAALLVPPLLVLYLGNAYFAPQSSQGVHLLLDTALAGVAFALAALLPRPRAGAVLAALVATAALLAGADQVLRARPRIETLVKTRAATAGRMVDLWRAALDRDRDGCAPPLLVGGSDPDDRDPRRPPPLLDAAGTAPLAHLAGAPAAGGPRPHILLLTLDACRHDVLPPATAADSRLGDRLPPLPRFAALAARSARFAAAYAPSAGTEDTFNSLFSGALPPGVLAGIPEPRWLARRMIGAGFAARALVNDPWFAPDAWGWPRIEGFAPDSGFAMVRAAAAFLDSLPDHQPGFVWVHVMDMHAGVLAPLSPDTYRHAAHVRTYARGLARVDSMVGVLVAELDRRGLAGRTLLALSADHGEELGGHGHYHHNLSLYESAIRVPLWIAGPGVTPRAHAATVAVMDLYPTLLVAAGVAPGRTAGRSLWPVLAGREPARSEPFHYAFLPHRGVSRRFRPDHRPERGQAALIESATGHKVILRYGEECWEAYDLADRRERLNLAGDAPWADSLRARLASVVRSHARPPSAP